MFITEALAQTVTGSGGGGNFLIQLMPFILIFAIMYFLIIRPQQKRMKDHREMIAAIRRGDTVVTAGGLIGKVTKVIDDAELQVELAEGLRVRAVRSTIAEVRSRGEPVKDSDKRVEDRRAKEDEDQPTAEDDEPAPSRAVNGRQSTAARSGSSRRRSAKAGAARKTEPEAETPPPNPGTSDGAEKES